MISAYSAGVLHGTGSDGSFNGYSKVTRGEASRLAREIARQGADQPDFDFKGYGSSSLVVSAGSRLVFRVTGYDGYGGQLTVVIPQPFPLLPIVKVVQLRSNETVKTSMPIGLGVTAYFTMEYFPSNGVGRAVGAYVNEIKVY